MMVRKVSQPWKVGQGGSALTILGLVASVKLDVGVASDDVVRRALDGVDVGVGGGAEGEKGESGDEEEVGTHCCGVVE